MKTCSRCKKELPIAEFAKTAKGVHNTCIHYKIKTKKQRAFKRGE